MVRSYDLRPGYMEKMTWKLAEKYKKVEEKEARYETTMVEDADILMVAYGTVPEYPKGQ